ncbi:MAG: ubiquinol oxidase subunit II [Pseudomonadota bacterium]
MKALKLLLLIATGIALVGCGVSSGPLLDPKGPVALAQRTLFFETLAIMMIVVVPVWIFAAWFVPRYRASNKKDGYQQDWQSIPVDVVVWLVPLAIIVAVGTYVWIYTHKLDPYKTIETDGNLEPFTVQVIAQDWKWLFLYPEQGIASVNELVFPSATPLELIITSDTVMNSFFVPALGSQIYAMAGMETELNLLAWEPGKFVGRNSQYSGDGFSKQSFDVIALNSADFDEWVAKVKQSQLRLDEASYQQLAKPSTAHPITHYSSFEAGLFNQIMAKYSDGHGSHGGHAAHTSGE